MAVEAMDGLPADATAWHLSEHVESAPRPEHSQHAVPRLYVFAGRNADEVLNALDEGRASTPWNEETKPPSPARLVLVAGDEEMLKQRSERARAHIQSGAPPGEGVHFRAAPVHGDLAFVFTSAGSAYHGMGDGLLAALPELGDRLAHRFEGFADAMGWVFDDRRRAPSNDQRLWGASCLSQMHAELTRGLLGLRPDAAIGYSSGESNSLFALGAWTDMDAMRREIDESGLYSTELAGRFDAVARAWGRAPAAGQEPAASRERRRAERLEKRSMPASEEIHWAVWGLLAPIARVREWIAPEDRVHLAIIHTANDCVIAGDADSCQRVVEAINERLRAGTLPQARLQHGRTRSRGRRVSGMRGSSIHRREVSPVSGVRFYSGGSDAAYLPDSEACTQTIMNQAHQTLDFSQVIERAWADGVRVFVEHGPMAACSGWIRDVLGERARRGRRGSSRSQGPRDRNDLRGDRGAGRRGQFPSIPRSCWNDCSPASREGTVDESTPQREGARMRLPAHLEPVRLPSPRRSERPSEIVQPGSTSTASTAPSTAVSRKSTRVPAVDGVSIMQPAPNSTLGDG